MHADKTRSGSLDTLRGLAIAYVIIGHYSHYFATEIGGHKVDWYISGFGLGGVILFFMLSGYLIYQQLQWQSPHVFASRRLFRIFPAYWLNVAIVFGLGVAFTDYVKFPTLDYLANLTMMQTALHKATVNGAYWSLIVELEFYLIIGIVFFAAKRAFLMTIPILSVLANIALYVMFARSSVLLTFLPLFFLGIYMRKLKTNEPVALRLAGLLALAVANLAWFQPHETASVLVFSVVNVATFVLLNRYEISFRWLNFLGNVSYSLYLLHTAIGFFMIEQILRSYPAMNTLVTVVGVTACMIVLSYFSYVTVEQYSISAGRQLEGHLTRLLGRARLGRVTP